MNNISAAIIEPDSSRFHHLGYATNSILNEMQFFSHLGYQKEGESFTDNHQGVTGCFLAGPGPRIELLQNLPNSTTLTPWLNQGIKVYHFAYLVDNFEAVIQRARSHRGKMIIAPAPAAAFDGRKICFFVFRGGLMLEFIEN